MKIAFQPGEKGMNMKQPAKPQPAAPANKAPAKPAAPAPAAPQQKKGK